MKKLLVVACMLLALTACGETESTTNEAVAPDENKVEVGEPEVVVTAKELLADYESNEMAADKKYKGKVLEVTGVVNSIDSGVSDNAVVQIGSGEEYDFMSVSAQGDEAFDEAAINISKGEKVTVTCISKGEVIGFPQLEDCVMN